MRIARLGMLTGMALALAACGGGDPELFNLRSDDDGPDEFAILPTKPLEIPEDLASLPPPTPGGVNLADPTPEADAFAALGGSAAPLSRPQGNEGLVRYTTRFGVDPGIRADLAARDLEWRQQNQGRLLERLFNLTVYYDAYEDFSLDKYRELQRFRAAGIRTPAVPPDPAPEE